MLHTACSPVSTCSAYYTGILTRHIIIRHIFRLNFKLGANVLKLNIKLDPKALINFGRTAKHRITLTTPYDSTGTLVFCCQTSKRNSDWSDKVVQIGDFRPIFRYISETVQDRI